MTNWCFMFSICLTVIKWPTLGVLSGPKDPIPLRHFGFKEILAKVDLMEDRFDRLMAFDESLVLPNPLVAGQGASAWGEGVAVYGAARGYRWQHTMPTLMASMYGFECEEEMADTKQYLLSHGSYQLEQVSLVALHDQLYFLCGRVNVPTACT